jgi:hypothetical protein
MIWKLFSYCSADRHLGRLDMYSEYVNIDLFIRIYCQRSHFKIQLKVLKPLWKKLLSKEEIAYEKKRRLGRGTKLYQ